MTFDGFYDFNVLSLGFTVIYPRFILDLTVIYPRFTDISDHF